MLMMVGQPGRLFLAAGSRHCLPRLHLWLLTPGGGEEKETEEDGENREESEKRQKILSDTFRPGLWLLKLLSTLNGINAGHQYFCF